MNYVGTSVRRDERRVGAPAFAVEARLGTAWLVLRVGLGLGAFLPGLAIVGHFWDLVLRDLEIALSAFTLGRLTEWRAAHLPLAGPSKRVGHPLHGRLAA